MDNHYVLSRAHIGHCEARCNTWLQIVFVFDPRSQIECATQRRNWQRIMKEGRMWTFVDKNALKRPAPEIAGGGGAAHQQLQRLSEELRVAAQDDPHRWKQKVR